MLGLGYFINRKNFDDNKLKTFQSISIESSY